MGRSSFYSAGGAYSRKTARAVRPGQGFWLYSKSSLNLIVDGELNESVARLCGCGLGGI